MGLHPVRGHFRFRTGQQRGFQKTPRPFVRVEQLLDFTAQVPIVAAGLVQIGLTTVGRRDLQGCGEYGLNIHRGLPSGPSEAERNSRAAGRCATRPESQCDVLYQFTS